MALAMPMPQGCYDRIKAPPLGHGLNHGCQCISITTDRTGKWPNPCIHAGSVTVCHSCSPSVSGILGRTTALEVGGSSPSGRTTFLIFSDAFPDWRKSRKHRAWSVRIAWRVDSRMTTYSPSILIEAAGSPLVNGDAADHNRLTLSLLQNNVSLVIGCFQASRQRKFVNNARDTEFCGLKSQYVFLFHS